MTKKFVSNKGESWEWEETPETTKAIKELHENIRQRNLKKQDDELNYDTNGK